MKNNVARYLVGLLLLGSAMIAQSEQTSGSTEKAITALENQWVQAQRTNKPDLLAPLWADKFISTGPDGKVSTRAQSLADERLSKYTSVDIEDLQITEFGDTAIASSVFKAKGTDAKGKAIDSHSRWTDTWVKMPNGAWQCVASHGSAIKMYIGG